MYMLLSCEPTAKNLLSGEYYMALFHSEGCLSLATHLVKSEYSKMWMSPILFDTATC